MALDLAVVPGREHRREDGIDVPAESRHGHGCATRARLSMNRADRAACLMEGTHLVVACQARGAPSLASLDSAAKRTGAVATDEFDPGMRSEPRRDKVRRFACDVPGCTRRIFTERLPSTAASYSRRTGKLTDLRSDGEFAASREHRPDR